MNRKSWSWKVAGLLVASACHQEPSGGADSTDTTSDGTTSPATAGESTGSTESSGGTTDVPDEPPPLPEGEVVCTEPLSTGKYWCWKVVALPALVEDAIDEFAADLDGDGRAELIMAHRSVDGVRCTEIVGGSDCLSVLSWTGEAFVRRGEPLVNGGGHRSQAFTYATDYDGDGDIDIVRPGPLQYASFFVNEGGVLQPRLFFEFPQEPNWTATPLPIDPNEDGILELFISQDGIGHVHEQEGETWMPIAGQSFVLPNCGEPISVVRADFDEDGTDDYAILEGGAICDYQNPATWDPGSPVISIYLTDPTTGTLREPTWVPVSGDFLASSGFPFWAWAKDLDEDGHVDLLFNAGVGEDWKYAIAYVLGNGDGTFEPYDVLLPPIPLREVTDLDGDGTLEIIAGNSIIQDLLGDPRATEIPLLKIVESANADLNGDGLVDLIMFSLPYKVPSWRVVLMSVPTQ